MLLIILAVLALIMLIPVGAAVSYDESGLDASAVISAVKIRLYPPSKKRAEKKAAKAEDEENKPEAPKPKKKLNLSFSELTEVAKIALKAIGRFGRGLVVDNLVLKIRFADPDPFTTVMEYNAACAALNFAAPFIESAVKIKKRDVELATDFEAESIKAEFGLEMAIRIGQILALAIIASFALLKVIINHRKAVKRQERTSKNGKQDERNDAVNDG